MKLDELKKAYHRLVRLVSRTDKEAEAILRYIEEEYVTQYIASAVDDIVLSIRQTRKSTWLLPGRLSDRVHAHLKNSPEMRKKALLDLYKPVRKRG